MGSRYLIWSIILHGISISDLKPTWEVRKSDLPMFTPNWGTDGFIMRTHKIGNKQIWGSEHLTHRRRERHEIVASVHHAPLLLVKCTAYNIHIYVCVRRYDIPQTLAWIACFPRTNRIELLSSARLKRSVSIRRCWLAMIIWPIDMYLKIKSVYQTLSWVYTVYIRL